MKNLNTIKRGLFLYPLLALSSMKAQVPDDWTVNPSNYEHFMTFTAVLKVNIVEVQNTSNVIAAFHNGEVRGISNTCLLYTSPSPRDRTRSRMPSSA